MKIDNLYYGQEGGYACLLQSDSPMFDHHKDVWQDGVIFCTPDGAMRSMLQARWDNEFAKVADYNGEDESVLRMIRRTNPGNVDLDFVRTFESWHESEIGITGHMLELAVAAAIERFVWEHDPLHAPEKVFVGGHTGDPISVAMTITTADLQRIVQSYEIERVPEPHGFRFVMTKSFPSDS